MQEVGHLLDRMAGPELRFLYCVAGGIAKGGHDPVAPMSHNEENVRNARTPGGIHTLQFIPHPFRELIVVSIGLGALVGGFYQLSRSLLSPFMDARVDNKALAEIIATHRFGEDEPDLRIVTIFAQHAAVAMEYATLRAHALV